MNATTLSLALETEAVVAMLSRTDSYASRPRSVEMVETHISWVFLTDRYVYKLKKPVQFDFVDYSTPQLRHQACLNEVRLNGRLAPGVYLGVLPITRNPRGRFQLNGWGDPIDWVVKMRRLPATKSLEALIVSGQLTIAQVDQLAKRLIDFYQQVPPVTASVASYRSEIESHVLANRSELLRPEHRMTTAVVRRVHTAQLRMLLLAPDLLNERVCDGRIVDGHGDLRPEHVYLLPAPTVIDCIEFNDRFRRLDVLDELGFLAMECDRLGTPWVGRRLLDLYFNISHDRPAVALLDFYKCYRACVRAKVLALRSDQMDAQGTKYARHVARDYMLLADRYASQLGPPWVIVVRGLSGTGKSTLAEALSERLGAELLQTDRIRREIFPQEPRGQGIDQGRYRPVCRAAVYNELIRRAKDLAEQGLSVILDGTFLATESCARVARLAQGLGAMPLIVRCYCSRQVALRRIQERIAQGRSLSEATIATYEHQRQTEEPAPLNVSSLNVDSNDALPAMLDDVVARLRPMTDAWWDKSFGANQEGEPP
jgi:aminoglycoside phosphotransferase family enzyme/predicted kinase